MTLAMQILKLLADGKLRSIEAVAVELNAPEKQVRNSVSWLRLKGMLKADFMYGVTAQGLERSMFKPKLNRPVRRAPPPSSKQRRGNAIVKSALRSQPALQSAWGAMA